MVFPLKPTGAGESRNTSSYGMDTIKVGYKITLSDADLIGWKHTSNSVVAELGEKVLSDTYLKKYPTKNGTVVTLKFVPNDYKARSFDFLFIEFSFPKLTLGINYQDIHDWPEAVRTANSIIASIPGLPPLPDIQDAILYRIDLCANLQVGEENVSDYIQALQKACHPHRKTKPYGENGVIFKSQEISTCIYDKFRESKCGEAKGILRYEISMRTRWKIRDWTGKTDPTLRDITPQKVKETIENDMRILHLDKPMVCDRLTAQAILSKIYTPSRVRALLGYLGIRQTLTVDQMKQEGYKSHNIRYYDDLLAKAGISSLSIESRKTLPALTLLLEDVEEPIIYDKVPSDTNSFGQQVLEPLDSYYTEGKSHSRLNTQPHGLIKRPTNTQPRAP